MASRYDSLDRNSNSAANDFTQTEQTTQNTTTNQTTTGQATRDSQSTTNERATTDFNIDTMSDSGRQAMQQLLATLAAGGTDEQRRILEEQLNTLQNVRGAQADYSRETALGDSEALMQTMLQRSMESALPGILAAGSGAGTSGDAITALLSQDLASRAAGDAAGVGVQAVQGYGGILAQLMGQEVAASQGMEDQALGALLEALGVDAGSMKRGQQTTNSRSTTRGRETTNSRESTSGSSRQTGTSIINRTPNSSRTSESSVGNASRVTNR